MKKVVPPELLKEVFLETPYGKTVTLRRSGVSKKAWDYICKKFGVYQFDSEKIVSLKVEGQDNFDRLSIIATIERDIPKDEEFLDELY